MWVSTHIFCQASILLRNTPVGTYIFSFTLVSIQAAFIPVLWVLFVSKSPEGSGLSSESLAAILSPGARSTTC